MEEIAKREWQINLEHARSAAAETREEASRAWFFARKAAGALLCARMGHKWGDWRVSGTIFVPPEQRSCGRCGGKEFRGSWPAIRVEPGSMEVHGGR